MMAGRRTDAFMGPQCGAGAEERRGIARVRRAPPYGGWPSPSMASTVPVACPARGPRAVSPFFTFPLRRTRRSCQPLDFTRAERLAPRMPGEDAAEAKSRLSNGVNGCGGAASEVFTTRGKFCAPCVKQLNRAVDRLRGSTASGTLRDGMTRRLIACAVVGVLVCGHTLAYGTPPDPTWIAGFWDDADYDDVVVRVISTSSAIESGLGSALDPHWMPIWTLSVSGDRLDPDPLSAPHRPRGPPPA